MTDITKQTLSELINNIKTKKISSEEITKAFIERSEKSKKLNTYITESFDRAIKKAKEFDQNPNFEKNKSNLIWIRFLNLDSCRECQTV